MTTLSDGPDENVSEDLVGHTDGYVQQGITLPSKLYRISGGVLDSRLQKPYAIFIFLAPHAMRLY